MSNKVAIIDFKTQIDIKLQIVAIENNVVRCLPEDDDIKYEIQFEYHDWIQKRFNRLKIRVGDNIHLKYHGFYRKRHKFDVVKIDEKN